MIGIARAVLPSRVRSWLVARQRAHRLQWPRAGAVDFGQLRSLRPISPIFGIDRGLAVDRYYIEAFLRQHAADIRGRALEMGDATYLRNFGGDRVTRFDVLSLVPGGRETTLVADLTQGDQLPSEAFDCIVFTQSLEMIYEFRAALRTLCRMLRPGGVLLLTTHGITKIARRLGRDRWGEYWHFTTQSIEPVLAETFPGGEVTVRAWGNVLAAVGYLHGLAAEEFTEQELDFLDPDFEVIVSARVRKASGV